MSTTDPSPPSSLNTADFVTGIVLVTLGVAVVVASLDMPRFAERNINPYTVPGLVPGMLGAVLTVLGAALFGRAAKRGGWRFSAARHEDDSGRGRLALALVLTLGYAAGLVGWLPFWLATALFVGGFVALFEWRMAQNRAERIRRIGFAVLYGALIAAVVTFVFQELFLVRLP